MGFLDRWRRPPPPPEVEFTVTSELTYPDRPPADPKYADRDDYDQAPILTLRDWDYGHGLEDINSGYGFQTPDGKIWAAHHCLQSTWRELGVLVLPVLGAQYHGEDLNDRGFEPGSPIRLFPEHDNPYDPHAIAVRNWTADKTAGYIKKGSTTRLRNLLKGHDIRVMSLSCRYNQAPPIGHREGMHIVIFRPDRLIGAEHIAPHPPVFD